MCITLEINVSDHNVNESVISSYDDLKEDEKKRCNVYRFIPIANWFVRNEFFHHLTPLKISSVHGACGSKLDSENKGKRVRVFQKNTPIRVIS